MSKILPEMIKMFSFLYGALSNGVQLIHVIAGRRRGDGCVQISAKSGFGGYAI